MAFSCAQAERWYMRGPGTGAQEHRLGVSHNELAGLDVEQERADHLVAGFVR